MFLWVMPRIENVIVQMFFFPEYLWLQLWYKNQNEQGKPGRTVQIELEIDSPRGTWLAGWLNVLTLDFGSDIYLRVLGFSPTLGYTRRAESV